MDVINAARCNAKVISGCRVVARAKVGRNPLAAAIDPGTDTVYVVNGGEQHGLGDQRRPVQRPDHPRLGRPVAAVKVGKFPVAAALNPATRTLYVANPRGAASRSSTRPGATPRSRGLRAAGADGDGQAGPDWIDVNVATDTVYAANSGTSGNGDTVSVIDGAACNGHTGRGCGRVPVTSRWAAARCPRR